MEQKNFILAIVLSVGFLFIWSVFVVPRFAPPPAGQRPSGPGVAGGGVTPPPPAVGASKPAELFSAHARAGQPTAPANSIFRNQENEIVLAPQGGGVQHWRLKSKGQEVDLVLFPDADPLPLVTFPEVLFNIAPRDRQAVMEAELPNGLRLTKTLTLSASGHLHDLTLRFQNPTHRPIELKKWDWGWGPGLGTSESERKENPGLIRALSLSKLKAHALKEEDRSEFGRWAGLDNRYYLVAFVPKPPHAAELQVTGKKEQTRLRILETTVVPAQGEALLEYRLYAGPKGYTQLKKYGQGLEEGVDFGMFSGLGKLILNAMYRLQSWTGNYGWAIVLLTVGIQILMLPLTLKSFKATMAMKKLQPKIAELQARFKGDPKRLNIEMMNLYKNAGTNPFGGCLPMLLQLPIFWALFTTLRNAYELQGASWIGWIHDLSVHDPYYILPIVMGGGMFLQQRMSGAVTDPTQRQMMYIMPVMFTVMFINFPSGLVLYWLTQNVITMAFQWGFQRAALT